MIPCVLSVHLPCNSLVGAQSAWLQVQPGILASVPAMAG